MPFSAPAPLAMHHNHCTLCPGFGRCLGDHRRTHCKSCNHHYFDGTAGSQCPYCFSGSDEEVMVGFW